MATVFVLAMPSASLAGKGGGHSGGNGGPKESVNFNYGKTQTTYKAQTTSSKKGKAKFHDLSITHKNDKASP
jgi:type VI protein secretion system component Hcp